MSQGPLLLQAQDREPRDLAGDAGVEANARLTAWTGALLFLLLAVEGVTILSVRRLLPVHVFVGLLLVPPVLLKFGSTF